MIAMAVLGGAAVVAVAAAAWYDHRARRHGSQVAVSRTDIEIREGRAGSSQLDDHGS
jgi:hypothetical protein